MTSDQHDSASESPRSRADNFIVLPVCRGHGPTTDSCVPVLLPVFCSTVFSPEVPLTNRSEYCCTWRELIPICYGQVQKTVPK